MNQVFVCGTYFQIYVSMLLTLYRTNSNSKNLLILNDHTPEIEKIIPALRANGFFDHYLFVPFRKIEAQVKRDKGFIGKILNRNKTIIHAVEHNSDIQSYGDFIATSELNFFYVWGYPSAYFVLKYPDNYSRIIEDGTRNYFLKTSHVKLFKRKYLLRTYIGDGFDDTVKEIQVQRPEELDPRVRHKGTHLPFKEMQNRLSPEENERILNVFMAGHSLLNDSQKKLLVITQPLSEDDFITEEYKVSLYRQIIDDYAGQYKVYLKPHPRELTNYRQQLQREFVEIPRSFPLEMLDLMKTITFEKGVTLFSSSLSNLECIEQKIQLGKAHVKEFLPGKKLV
jgi:Glycosyltransferase family 52